MRAVPIEERFWTKVDIRGPDDCWPWTAALDTHGYGQIRSDRGPTRIATRVAWELTYGAIPKGKQVLHKCDNRQCTNPSHFFLGTNADNVADKVNKGRAGNKLTTETARQILISDGTLLEIGNRFGVSFSMVGSIKRGDAWSHIHKEINHV